MSDQIINRPYVSLNVGGKLFQTTVNTLSKCDSMLRTMVNGDLKSVTDEQGWIHIDRSGKHFGTILNYLRDGSVPLPADFRDIEELLAEAQYYRIDPLITTCQEAIEQKKQEFGNVKLVSTPEEQMDFMWLAKASNVKPLIKLQFNLSNRDYDFCPGAEDILLQHIELFFKLARKFGDKGYFVVDTVSQYATVCAWSFNKFTLEMEDIPCTFNKTYPMTHNRPETHCTEIIFPEAQIMEEALAMFLSDDSPFS